jgi:hypothetical protein
MMQTPKIPERQMLESDYSGLPSHTRKFVERIHRDGLDRVRIHGLFVLLGLCAGAPDTQSRIDKLFQTLSLVVPVDRTRNIDEVVGHVYDGYDRELSEFCYRSGAVFEFREIKVPKVDESFYIVNLRDHGLFEVDVVSIERLADASRLYDAFILAIGHSTANRQASLIEAFGCGIFQILLHARSDISGSMQIAELIKSYLPLVYSWCFNTLQGNSIEYFLGLERGQVPLLSLMQPMATDYAKQMWGFQSSLFYRDQEPIDGVDVLTVRDWHAWVLQNAKQFDTDYPTELIPFSKSNIALLNIPQWRSEVEKFEICDAYIDEIWGYSASSITGDIETLEYKALLVHLVYSSLTSTKEVIH